MKGQILADFIIGLTNILEEVQATPAENPWGTFVDGLSYHFARTGVVEFITIDSIEELYYEIMPLRPLTSR